MNKTPPTITPPPATIQVEALAELSGLSGRRLYQLAEETKLPPISNGSLPMVPALKSLFAWLQRDSETLAHEKLLLLTAERKIAERAERVAEKLEAKTYVEFAAMERLVLIFVGKLELVPVKLESEFGLEKKIIERLTELLDEARREMAKAASNA